LGERLTYEGYVAGRRRKQKEAFVPGNSTSGQKKIKERAGLKKGGDVLFFGWGPRKEDTVPPDKVREGAAQQKPA